VMRTLLPKFINHSVSPGGGVVPSTVNSMMLKTKTMRII
jgi:hypothetical protein